MLFLADFGERKTKTRKLKFCWEKQTELADLVDIYWKFENSDTFGLEKGSYFDVRGEGLISMYRCTIEKSVLDDKSAQKRVLEFSNLTMRNILVEN